MKKTLKKISSIILAATAGVLSSATVIPAYAAEDLQIIKVETQSPSEYGYQDYRYVDVNGDEVVFETEKMFTQSTASPLPSKYDSRDYGYITDVKYQGTGGNCWAYSSLSALETNSIMKGYKTKSSADFSEAHLTWFAGRGLAEDKNDLAYGDGHNAEDPFYYGGNWIRASAALARWSGVANESEFPSYPYNISSMGNYDESDRYNTSSGVVIESAQILRDSNDIKQWIIENGSATVAFYYDDTSCINKKTYAYYCPDAQNSNHMVTVIGWDDNYSASNFTTTPPANGAWICKNSWGKNWGNSGCFMISYYDATLKNAAGFTARSTEDCYKNYTYNGAENIAYLIENDGFAGAANVFKSEGKEKLNAVGVQTLGEGIKIKIKIYKNLPKSYNSPETGTLAATKEVLLDREGYHTIYLDNEISLDAGEVFSVVVEYRNTLSNTIHLPIEINGRTPVYSCRQGESFVYNKSVSRYLDTSVYYTSIKANNVYIQAFTECDHQNITETKGNICVENGTEITMCAQCGKTESEKTVYCTGHRFKGWSDFSKNSNGDEISTRSCLNCGLTETKSTADVNIIQMNRLIDILLSRIRIVFSSLFSK